LGRGSTEQAFLTEDASSTNGLVRQRSKLAAERDVRGAVEQDLLQRRVGAHAAHDLASDFSKIPRFSSDRSHASQTSAPLTAFPTPGIMQRKLTVGEVNDPLEREADRVADEMMRMPNTGDRTNAARAPSSGQCVACEREETPQFGTTPTVAPIATSPEAPSVVDEVLRAPGEPLDAATRATLEPRLGYDFSQVRVHVDSTAAESARAVNASAYTVGNHLVFDRQKYAPHTEHGQKLLAHELAHVVQQRAAGRTPSSSQAKRRPTARAAVHLQRQVYGPAASTGAGADFDVYLLQFNALEQAAITEGYNFNDRVTAFRKLYYDSASAAKTYAGAVVGGGAFNILIPGAAGTKIPASWSTPPLDGAADYLRKHQTLQIGAQSVDIGHLLAGADATRHPTSVSLGGGMIKLRSNVEATTFVGDLGSVVAEYIHGSKASFHDTAMKRSKVLDTYYDGSKAMASAEDMAGNADAYALSFDPSKSLTDNLKGYYAAATGGVKKRFTNFAISIGLGTLNASTFTGDTKVWRQAMTEEVFNSALAYAAGKGWNSDVINVMKDPGPGVFAPTFWEMYWNNSEWVVDIFVDRMTRNVAKE
jgi:hypothetical protein